MPSFLRTRTRRATSGLVALIAAAAAFGAAAPVASAGWLYWEPSTTVYWAVNHTTVFASFQNGQCTQWAAQKRPDIVKRAVLAIVNDELATSQPEGMGDWTAKNWPLLGLLAGLREGHTPRAGAVVVFQPGVDGAGAPTGHVAYVERVYKDGRTRISEMHFPLLGRVTHRTLTRAQARAQGVTYIYR